MKIRPAQQAIYESLAWCSVADGQVICVGLCRRQVRLKQHSYRRGAICSAKGERIARLLITSVLSACRLSGPGTDPIPIVPALRESVRPVAAVVESSLVSGKKQIRQFAFDSDPDTYFASEQNAGKSDYFTLTLDRPVNANSVRILTGDTEGLNTLDSGVVEVSADGKLFAELAKFANGSVAGVPRGRAWRSLQVGELVVSAALDAALSGARAGVLWLPRRPAGRGAGGRGML